MKEALGALIHVHLQEAVGGVGDGLLEALVVLGILGDHGAEELLGDVLVIHLLEKRGLLHRQDPLGLQVFGEEFTVAEGALLIPHQAKGVVSQEVEVEGLDGVGGLVRPPDVEDVEDGNPLDS